MKNEKNIHPSECEKINNQVVLEGMTSISALINGIRGGVNSRRIHAVLISRDRVQAKVKELGFLRAVSGEMGFVFREVDESYIDEITSGETHGGIVALCSDRPLPLLCMALENEPSFQKENGFYVMPEGVEDPYNFGYALRSFYAAGADGIILPPHNWMSAAGTVARSSAGACELFPMAIASPLDAVMMMKARGYRVLCAGIRDSVSLHEADMSGPILLIIGGEKRGISRAVLDAADEIVRIDYGREFRGSLSAACAASVLAFEVLRQRNVKE